MRHVRRGGGDYSLRLIEVNVNGIQFSIRLRLEYVR